MGQRDAAGSGQHRCQPFVAQFCGSGRREQPSGEHDVFDQRLHRQSAAQRFEYRGDSGRIEVQPAGIGSERRGEQAEVTQQRPVSRRKAIGIGKIAAPPIDIVAIDDKALGQRLDHFLVFAEIEVQLESPFQR